MDEEEETTGPRSRRTFWRSASWSSSSGSPLGVDGLGAEKNSVGSYGGIPVPLTPRSQQNSKARSCLPPLQPLSIARRSVDQWPKAGSDDIGDWLQPRTPSGRREGLKLDLGSSQKTQEPTGTQIKRDQLAHFDKECSKVADHIYLGGDAVARNRDILRENGITHVLNCVGFVCPEYFKTDLVYKTLWLQDNPSEDITSILYDVFDYFEDVRDQGGRVLVHCCQGVSRSTSLVIAYLMWREGQSFEDAFQYVKAARGITNPNMGFACQLLQCQKRVHAVPLSPSSILRMYRMAPHSPYDPLHLVPKMLNEPSLLSLDSRGAFIVQVPSAIYVWIGKKCELVMERDAKAAAVQVVRYERVQGPIVTIVEGEELSDFWDAFSKCPLSVDNSNKKVEVNEEQVESLAKIEAGKKKVDAYDIDFEIFERAITGGVVPAFSSSGAGSATHLPARENGWSILRRKFVCKNVKDWISASRAASSRIYSDSVLMKDKDARVNRVQLLSPSLPCLSPSSLISDSNTSPNSIAESLSLSPSTSSPSYTPSPSSILLDSSTLSSKSPCPVPDCPEPSKDKYPSKPFYNSVVSQSNGFSLSLAARRGSMSPSLKLPPLKDGSSLVSRKVKNIDDQISGSEVFDESSSSERLLDAKRQDIVTDRGASVRHQRQTCFGELRRNFPSQEGQEGEGLPLKEKEDNGLFLSSGLIDNFSEVLNPRHPIIFRVPDLKKIAAIGACDLDSKLALIFLVPSLGCPGKQKVEMVYFWVGSDFRLGNLCGKLDSGREKGEVEEIDWKLVGCDFLTLIGLPVGIPLKVVKEEEEPDDFLQLLGSLSYNRDGEGLNGPTK